MSQKHKSVSSSAIQLKKWRMTISTEEVLDMSRLEKGRLLTYGIMLDSLIVAYIQDVMTVAYRGGGLGCSNPPPPPEIPKSLQNRAKLNPICENY